MSDLCAHVYGMTGGIAIVEGPPGAAKSAKQVAYYTEERGYWQHTLPVTSLIPEDFMGLQFPVDGAVKTLAPDLVDNSWAAHNRGLIPVILLDEFKSCSAMVFAVCLRLLQERSMGPHKLPPTTLFFGTCNPADIAANGNEFPMPIANRVGHFSCDVDLKAWQQGIMNGFPDPTWPMLPDNWKSFEREAIVQVVAYTTARPEQANMPPTKTSEQSGPYPSFRSWTNLATGNAGLLSLGLHEDYGHEMAQAVVGQAVGGEFMTYITNLDLRSPQECWDLGSKYKVPSTGDRQYAELNSMTAALVRDITPKNFADTWAVIEAAAKQGSSAEAAGCCPIVIKEVYSKKTRTSEEADYKIPKSAIKTFAPILKESGII